MTEPGNKQKNAYNKMFGEFVEMTRKTADAAYFDQIKVKIDELSKKYLGLFDAKQQDVFDILWNKGDEQKRYIINVFLQSASFSARLAAIVE